MQQPTGDSRPLFPAGALGRYVNPDHPSIEIDDLGFQGNYGSGTDSTDPTINILHDDPRFESITAFLRNCIADYLDNIVSYQYESFSIIHSWVNRAGDGAIQRMHYHGNSVVSGVYYLYSSRSNSPLIFEKTEVNTSPYLAIAPREQTLYNANRMAFPAESGVCYLFPSNVKHGYDVPNQGGTRVSIAFNVMLNGIGLFYQI